MWNEKNVVQHWRKKYVKLALVIVSTFTRNPIVLFINHCCDTFFLLCFRFLAPPLSGLYECKSVVEMGRKWWKMCGIQGNLGFRKNNVSEKLEMKVFVEMDTRKNSRFSHVISVHKSSHNYEICLTGSQETPVCLNSRYFVGCAERYLLERFSKLCTTFLYNM